MRVGFGVTQTFGEVCLSSEAASDYLLSLCSHGGYSESPPVRVATDSKGNKSVTIPMQRATEIAAILRA